MDDRNHEHQPLDGEGLARGQHAPYRAWICDSSARALRRPEPLPQREAG